MNFKKPDFWDYKRVSFWSILLFPLSLIFLLISKTIRILKTQKKFPVPVICVGNIYVGGTGKTPLALEIFNIIKSLGKNPGFVKKYYDYLDDEISMLKKAGATFVSKNRIDAIKNLIENKNDIAILDDGFQDFTIKKNFSILCFNQKQWIGNGFIIPAGPLREKLSEIKRANCVIINGQKNINIEDQIYKKNKNVKIFYSKYKPINIDRFKDKKICAFAGIGNTSNFFDLLKDNKLNLINTISFPDHYKLSKSDHEKLLFNSKDAVLLTTEKDYSRFTDNSIINRSDIQYLKIELEIENKDNFIELIKKNI